MKRIHFRGTRLMRLFIACLSATWLLNAEPVLIPVDVLVTNKTLGARMFWDACARDNRKDGTPAGRLASMLRYTRAVAAFECTTNEAGCAVMDLKKDFVWSVPANVYSCGADALKMAEELAVIYAANREKYIPRAERHLRIPSVIKYRVDAQMNKVYTTREESHQMNLARRFVGRETGFIDKLAEGIVQILLDNGARLDEEAFDATVERIRTTASFHADHLKPFDDACACVRAEIRKRQAARDGK